MNAQEQSTRGHKSRENSPHPKKESTDEIVIEPLKGKTKSVIPKEAVEVSRQVERQKGLTPPNPDPYGEEKINPNDAPVDSSEETKGG